LRRKWRLEVGNVETERCETAHTCLHICEPELNGVGTTRFKSAADRDAIGYWSADRWGRCQEGRVVGWVLIGGLDDEFEAHVGLPKADARVRLFEHFKGDS
jgi:hypothetical protein